MSGKPMNSGKTRSMEKLSVFRFKRVVSGHFEQFIHLRILHETEKKLLQAHNKLTTNTKCLYGRMVTINGGLSCCCWQTGQIV